MLTEETIRKQQMCSKKSLKINKSELGDNLDWIEYSITIIQCRKTTIIVTPNCLIEPYLHTHHHYFDLPIVVYSPCW